MKTPRPKTMKVPEGDWFVLANGHMLAKFTGPTELVFTAQYIQPLTEEEQAVNKATRMKEILAAKDVLYEAAERLIRKSEDLKKAMILRV